MVRWWFRHLLPPSSLPDVPHTAHTPNQTGRVFGFAQIIGPKIQNWKYSNCPILFLFLHYITCFMSYSCVLVFVPKHCRIPPPPLTVHTARKKRVRARFLVLPLPSKGGYGWAPTNLGRAYCIGPGISLSSPFRFQHKRRPPARQGEREGETQFLRSQKKEGEAILIIPQIKTFPPLF